MGGSRSIESVRGMHDTLPGDTVLWRTVEENVRRTFIAYGYHEIRLPLVEKTELFSRSIGEETDIVAKEMYTFTDRNGDELTLRPEGTAGCVRAGIENGLLHNQQQRLWYLGPMFRHERPQRGRYRQFHQAGVEAFGWNGPDIDAELIAIGARIFRSLGLQGLTLELNSLGTEQSRAAYRDTLVAYLRSYREQLDPDSRRRLETNPLRVLDSKEPATRELLGGAPDIRESLDPESRSHFEELCRLLDGLGIAYRVNPRLVRGLDYYTRTVFEWMSDELGAQGTVCAGGRYDGLVQRLGHRHPVPAAGFALGLERIVELTRSALDDTADGPGPDIYIATAGAEAKLAGMRLAEEIRDGGYIVQTHCGDEGLKNQMKRADRSGATLAVIIGDNELQRDLVTIKPLRAGTDQQTVNAREAIMYLAKLLDDQVK